MYQTFSGSSKRPRQVNLSGRNPANPFTKNDAIASAQQDRQHRQLQRERIQASSRIQKAWRGHRSRRRTFQHWRGIWDQAEESAKGAYETQEDSLRQLRRLILFFSPRSEPTDVHRLTWYGTRQVTTSQAFPCTSGPWPVAYGKLRKMCLSALNGRRKAEHERTLLGILAFAARQTKFTTQEAIEYYEALTHTKDLPAEPLQGALLAPLQSKEAYAGLVVLLTKPLDSEMLALLQNAVDAQTLARVVLDYRGAGSSRERLWLLGNMIDLAGSASTNMTFTAAVGRLLGSLADDVEFEGSNPSDMDNVTFDQDILAKVSTGLPLNKWLSSQTLKLLEQQAVRNLLSGKREDLSSNGAQVLAGYALTLLRCFPRRADDTRMWLHLGPITCGRASPTGYLWEAARACQVFSDICASSRGVVQLLKAAKLSPRQKDDWTVILVLLEMLTFDLKIMDDEEFMGSSPVAKRNSAVPIGDVAQLVTFLKNLGFTLYFDAAELNDSGAQLMSNLTAQTGKFMNSSTANVFNHPEAKTLTVAGLPGLTIDYLKGLVTGLLRAVYERDSRRRFLPKNHWLMTDRFNMETFITGVVAEEESRHQVQEQDDEDKVDDSDDESEQPSGAVYRGSGYARVLLTQEARARALRKASRKRYLESVAPRLEILQIFRQFVHLDQHKRRNGAVDPDIWRQTMMMQPQDGMPPRDTLERHHAKIKRTREFQDAYEQFYDLGPALKEPIQITFVDKWDMPEAGIDGGGVTKEFLTSVISQTFDSKGDENHHFFVENDQHLLHPNPTVFEDLRTQLEGMDLRANSPEMREQERELQRQYEFLGRIIGKCLYEGILVDVSFAGFFLKKWSLTGGTGSAPNESHYRPSVNDVRELDESLYRGLLKLKNADNAEDFGLDFSVNNEVGPEGGKKIVDVELIPNGANTTVTNENKLIYINRMVQYRLQSQSKRQTIAFLRGLGDIVEPSWLSMFNQIELQTLIGGAAAGIDVEDLRNNTQYGGVYVIGDDGQEHLSVKLFWDVMKKMADEDRRKVLKFVTSTPRGPLLGFGHLNPRFSIRDSGSDENRFPTTSTCVNLLKLPMYKSARVLREKLLAAVNSGAGFDLS